MFSVIYKNAMDICKLKQLCNLDHLRTYVHQSTFRADRRLKPAYDTETKK